MSDERAQIRTFLTDIAMGESAHWHQGRFWCSDWVAGEILAADLDGARRGPGPVELLPVLLRLAGRRHMVVTGTTGLERLGPDRTLVPYVDLTGLISHDWNEVVVDPRGTPTSTRRTSTGARASTSRSDRSRASSPS